MPDLISTEAYGRPVPASLLEREQDREFVLEWCARSNDYRESRLRTLQELIDNYLCVPFGYSRFNSVPRLGHPLIASPGLMTPSRRKRSVLKDPETHQNVEALAAQSLGLLFGSPNYLTALPIGADDYEKARILSRLLMATLESPGVFRTLYQTWKDAHITGTAILEMGWQVRSRQQVTEVPVIDENGQIVAFTYEPQEVVYQEGPMFGQVDIFDAYPDPSGTRIQRDMMGFAKRFRITRQQAEALAESGKYDKEGVQRAIERSGHTKEYGDIEGRTHDMTARSLPDKFGTMVGIEYWGFCPYSHADKASNRAVTLLNGELVRSTINPHNSGQIPFKEIVINPMTGQFYGLSSSETGRFLQDSVDNMLMLLNDAADLMVRPAMLAGIGFGGNVERVQHRGLNDIITCNNVEALKEIPTNLGSIGVMQSEHARRKLQMREQSGAALPQLMASAKEGRTATESAEVSRLASQRMELQVLLWERDDLPWVGRFVHQMLRQFTDEEGGVALFNGESLPFTLDDIDFDADVRFVGSRQARSKYQQNLQLTTAIQTIAGGMNLIPIMPELFVRLLRDGNDIADAEQIIAQAVQRVQAMPPEVAGSKPGSAPKQSEPAMTETGAAEQEGRMMG